MKYPGGKGAVFRQLLNLMPPHEVYIETHLGGGNVLERKRPAAYSIGVDIDPDVINAWRVLSDWSGPLELVQADAVAFLRSYNFIGGELVYSDPPYLHSTRRDLSIYRYEYTEAQHVELLEVLASLPCAVMLSGYRSPLYDDFLQHRRAWRCHEFNSTTRRGVVRECVWYNFEPGALHDARYAGDNYRERERIKRKRQRWRARLAAMSPAERQVILEALQDLAPPPAAVLQANAAAGTAGAGGVGRRASSRMAVEASRP